MAFIPKLSHKKIFLIIAVLIIILTALATFIKKDASLPKSTDNQNLISITPFIPGLNPQQSFSDLTQNQEKAQIILLSPLSSQDIMHLLNNIILEYNFSQPPTEQLINSKPFLYWRSTHSYLNVNQQTGQFELKLTNSDNFTTPPFIAEIDALHIAQNWLLKHQLISENTTHKASYYIVKGYEFEPTDEVSQAQIFQFSFSPIINDLPIFNPDSNSHPIIIEITNKGNVLRVNYQALPSLMKNGVNNAVNVKIKSLNQIKKEIDQKQPIITHVGNHPYQSHSINPTEINQVSYNKIILGYQLSTDQSQLIPIFQLNGTAKTNNDESISVTAYLPAIAE